MISPIENNGMIAISQDISAIQQHNDGIATLHQSQIQRAADNQVEENAHSVQKKDDADKPDTHHDAREEGRNKYFNNRKNKPKKGSDADGAQDASPADGFMVPKGPGRFDIKI